MKEAEEDLHRILALDRDLASGTLQSKTISESLSRCVDALVRHLDAALARIWMLNESEGVLELRASAGLYTHIDGAHGRIRMGELKIGLIAQERRPHLTNAVIGDPRVPNQEWAMREGLVSFAGYPLLAEDRLLGVVGVFARRPLSELILQAMGSVALRIAYTIDHFSSEEVLRNSELKYRRLYESMMDAFVRVDLAGSILESNPAFEVMVGYSAEELRKMTYQDLTPGRWHEWEDRIISEQVLARGHSEVYEKEYRHSDGTVFPVELRAFLLSDSDGRAIGIWAIVRDITERKRAQQRLEASEARLRKSEGLLKQAERIAHLGHWQWDIKSNAVSWSEEIFRIFGKPEDYAPSFQAFLDAIVPEDRGRMETVIKRCLEAKTGHTTEYRLTRPNGDVRMVLGSCELSLDEDGLPAQLFGASQDITESKRAQDQAAERQKLESVGTLANGIAHDFNNLLGGVLAHAELALLELAAGSHPEEELRAIRAAAVRGSEIVRQLMIYAGKEDEVVHSADLSRIVEEMVDLLKFSVSKRATLITNLGKDLPPVQASAGQLRQIVMNLVTNASEAIGDCDGVIRVTTECAAVAHDQTRFTPEDLPGNYLKLEVSDTGCGMSPETQARMFDPFYTTKSAGHGLGLAVVQGTIRSLRGTIHVQSQPGKGTTFEVLLPCARTAATLSPMSSVGEPARSWQEVTVLIVEDEESLRQPVSKLMRKAGFSVLEAADGSAALDLIRAQERTIDILFLDITLPGTPSREVFEQATRLRPDTSVIVASAYSKDLAEQKLGWKIECFLRKPYQLKDLMDLVRQRVL